MNDIFTKIYNENGWNHNNNILTYSGGSGPGSTIEFNINTYVPFLRNFIITNNIKSCVDLGCGDFVIGPIIYNDIDIKYSGYDTYDKVIYTHRINYNPNKYTFNHLDFFSKKDQIIGADMCILKDVLQHWRLENINVFMDYIVSSKKFKYILIINCSYQNTDNTDIQLGDFMPLSSKHFPLKKYNPTKIFEYNNKEVCLIKLF